LFENSEFPSELAVLFGWNSGVGLSGPGNTEMKDENFPRLYCSYSEIKLGFFATQIFQEITCNFQRLSLELFTF
jgi:hypothetical protein